jgi:hypothetical protein
MQPSPALERALRTALVPWGMTVARSRARAGPASSPRNARQARELARVLRADALIWISGSPRRHQLWLYDDVSGAMRGRRVPAPPFDETRAAALALSVKTALRKGTLAHSTPPPGEAAAKSLEPPPTDAAEPSASPPEPSTPPPEPSPPAPTPPAVMQVAKAARASAGEAPTEAIAPSPVHERASSPDIAELDTPHRVTPREPFDAPSLRLLLHAGVRGAASSLGLIEGRYGVEGRWAPWASPSSTTTIWFGARFDLGLEQSFATAAFRGEYSEIGGGLGIGASVHVTHWLDVGIQLAGSMYTASVSGAFLPDLTVEATRSYGATLHARPELELSFGTFGLVLQPAVGAAIARQRYEGQELEVMELNPVWWQVGGAFRVDVD